MDGWSIRRRGGLFLFRTRIPLKLRDRFGRAEIVRSLPVRKRADAERLAPMVMSRCDVAFDLVAKSPEATQAECLDVLSRVIATAFPPPTAPVLPKRDKPLPAEQQQRIADHDASLVGLCRALGQARTKGMPIFAPLIEGAMPDATSQQVRELTMRSGEAAMSRYAEANLRTQSDIVRAAFPDIVQPEITIHKTSLDARVLRILVAMPPGERHRDYLTRDDARSWLQTHDDAGEVTDEAVEAFLNSRKQVLMPAEVVHAGQVKVDNMIRSGVSSALDLTSNATAAQADQDDPSPSLTHWSCETTAEGEAELSSDDCTLPPTDDDPFASVVRVSDKISKVWSTFVANMKKERDWTEGVGDQSLATLKLIIGTVGDIPLGSFNSAVASQIRMIALALPSHYAKTPCWVSLANNKPFGLKRVAAAYAAWTPPEGEAKKCMTKKTWNRHLSILNALLAFREVHVVGSKDPAPKLPLFLKPDRKLTRSLSRGEKAKKVYSDEQVFKFVNHPHFLKAGGKGRKSISYRHYFGPLIVLNTGARISEIFQLKVGDVPEVLRDDGSSIWFFDLTREDLQLKNEAAHRRIPVHQTLVDLGLLTHLVKGRGPDEPLFPDLTNPKAPAAGAAKWVLRLVKGLDIEGGRGNHRARNTVITRLNNAGVPKAHIEELTGHTNGQIYDLDEVQWRNRRGKSEFDTYNGGLEPEVAWASMNKLRYNVDFSHLPTWEGPRG